MVSVAVLALIAAVVSFGHMHELVIRHGETRLNATLIPLSVDGMVVASSMSVLAGEPGWEAWGTAALDTARRWELGEPRRQR